jgi:hypothetical protein
MNSRLLWNFPRKRIPISNDSFPRSDFSNRDRPADAIMSDAPSERDLIRKLVVDWHLNVPERKELSGGKAKVSLILAAIEEIVKDAGCYPATWQLEDDFSGAWIQRQADGSCIVYFKAEYAMCRTTVVRKVTCESPHAAAEMLLREEYGDEIDGVPLDWNG